MGINLLSGFLLMADHSLQQTFDVLVHRVIMLVKGLASL